MRGQWRSFWFVGLCVLVLLLLAAPAAIASDPDSDADEEGCTTWGVSGVGTYDGFALIGGNSDNDWQMRASLVYRVPDSGYRYVAAEVPIKGMIRAVNEKGFAFGRNNISPDPEWRDKLGTKEGISNEDLTVKLATQAANVDEAVEILRNTPRQPVVWKVFTFADAAGKVLGVEVTPETIEIIEPDQYGWVSLANHFQTPNNLQYDTRARREGSSSWYRHNRALELRETVRGQKVDPYKLMEFASDTKNMDAKNNFFNSIAQHGQNSGTIFSYVLQPSLKMFWYCYGPSDGQVFWHEGTWGQYIPFALPQMKPGQYVTEDGIVSPEYPAPYAREHLRLRPLKLFAD